MKLTPVLMSAALALAIGIPIVGCAQQSADQPTQTTQGTHEHHGMMPGLRGLNLSDQQKTQIKAIVTQYRQAHPKGSTPDRAARKAMRDQIMAILTPDQQTQFKTNMQRAREQREEQQSPQPEATATPS